MTWFKWFAKLFGFYADPVPGFSDSDDDPITQAVLSECWRTGKTVIGSMDDDGKFTMEVCEDETE